MEEETVTHSTTITSTEFTTGDASDISLDVGSSLVADAALYGASDVVVLSSGSMGNGQYGRNQEDLSSFKKRIDANTEDQREHAGLMADLQRKIEEYRRRIAAIEGQVALCGTDDNITFNIKDVSEAWRPDLGLVGGSDLEAAGFLEEERRRNNELQIRVAQQQMEMQSLRQQFDMSMQEKDRAYQIREKNLAQYLAEEQQKLAGLWAELQQVRAQFADYRDVTERDLENQRNEFARVTRNVGSVVRRLSITSLNQAGGGGQDNELVDAIKRFRDQQTAPHGTSTDEYNALMKKYEESIERIVELESRGDGSVAKLSALEEELKRTKRKLSEGQEALRKLNDMAKEADTKGDLKKRPRSLSPGSVCLSPSEVVRNVRSALRSHDNQLQQLQRNCEKAQSQVTELTARFESAEQVRKRLEKQLNDAKRELTDSRKAVDEAVREGKRSEDRLNIAEIEIAAADSVRTKLEEEIRRLKAEIEHLDAEGARSALDEAESRRVQLEEEFKTRMDDAMRRMEVVQEENKRQKSDLAGLKEKHRNLEMEHAAALRSIHEKEVAVQNLEEAKGDLTKELDNQRTRFDAMTSELDNLQADLDSNSRTTVAVEMTVKEIKRQRDDINQQKDDLSKRLVEMSRRLAIEIKQREDIQRSAKCNADETTRLKQQIADYDQQVMSLREHSEGQDTALKTSMAKITTLENSLTSARNEVNKLVGLNEKLQAEKHDIMNARSKSDVELDGLRNRLRKLEQEIEKLRLENEALHEEGAVADRAFKEETMKVHQLVMELKDAKAEIDELDRKLAQHDEDHQIRLENSMQTGKADTYNITEVTTETKVKQLGDKHKLDLLKLENDKDDLSGRVRLLEDELVDKQNTIDAQLAALDDGKKDSQAEIERLKAELKDLTAKHQIDLDDERDHHTREIGIAKAEVDDMRNKMTSMEKQLEDARSHEESLGEEVANWEGKCDALHKDINNLHDRIEHIRGDADKEVQKWKTELYTAQVELKNMESANETARIQLNVANERASSLNKTVNDQLAKIREQDELATTSATMAGKESELVEANARTKAVEEQYEALQLSNNKLIAQIDAIKRKLDELNHTNSTNESEIERLKKKVSQVTALNKAKVEEMERLRNERDELERGCREKTKMAEQLSETIQMLETKTERMHQELQTINDKLMTSESEKNTMRTQLKKYEQELQFGNELLHRKTDEFHAALEEVAGAHRASEDGRVNAMQQLETRRFEVADLQSRLDNAEQRLVALQQEYVIADKERELLNDSLRRFQCVISRSMITESGGPIDIQTIDVLVQKLVSRNEKLEREKNQYRDSLNRLQRKASDSSVAINKHEHMYKSIEEKVVDIEEEKRSLEVKLASAKELLQSQEDALKQRDDERHTMKQKIIAFELETRGKDAQIRHLNELVKTLRSELEGAQSDMRALRDREEQWETAKIMLESKVRDHDGETQKMNVLMATFDTERQNLNDSVTKLASKLLSAEAKGADLKDETERLKRDLSKAERVEIELRRSLEEQTRIARECQHLRDQLGIAQNDLSNANNRKQLLEAEVSSVRSELRDNKQTLRDATAKVSDLERQLLNAQTDKNRLNDRIGELEKVISGCRCTESELRQKLLTSVSEVKALQTELEDVRRRISQFEANKHTANQKVEELKNIRITLNKKIEIMHTEKRILEQQMNDTAMQREAIERSLSALERENKELYKNCSRLQQQVAQLEMDNGSRLIALTSKQKEEHERFVQAVKAEKIQVERMVENRDRMQMTRIKQLESQLSMLRDQLNSERLRRRDAAERVLMNDMAKLGGACFGSLSSGSMSAGPVYPQSSAFDRLVGSGSGFASSYMMSPPVRCLSPIRDLQQPPSSLLTLNDPLLASSVAHGEDLTVNGDGADVLSEKRKTLIVVHMKGTSKDGSSVSSE